MIGRSRSRRQVVGGVWWGQTQRLYRIDGTQICRYCLLVVRGVMFEITFTMIE